ncbi:MAG: benzoate-CoA ligase family protein [Alphaproteobacteria bacterium]|nr:benzoate-CoA ligase family protein [Alphaproteobacteria bacterium]
MAIEGGISPAVQCDMPDLSDPFDMKFPPGFNAASVFIDRHLREGRGAKIAIHSVEGDVSYGELICEVNRVANGLTGLGLARGDRVLMVIRDCPAFFYAFWGVIKAGFIPVALNTLLRADTYAFIIDNSKAAAIIYSPENISELGPAFACAEHKIGHVLATEGGFDALRKKSSDDFAAVAAGAEEDCFWLYSSGSTGRPKGVVHRHRDMVATSQFFGVDTLGLREDDVCFSEAKLFFAYGLGNNLTFPLWVGATAVLNPGRPGPEASFPIIARYRPTVHFGVPTLYATYVARWPQVQGDFSSVRFCASGGEPLPAWILQRWHELTGLWILDGVGSTENLHNHISNRLDDIKPGSSGKPVRGYRARIMDEEGREIAGAGIGRLWVCGGSVARCYWNNPEKTASTMVDGWLDTGDTYRRDADGYYYYCGRNDDMMKVGGIWCSPFDIESRLIEHAAVLEAAVISRADAAGLMKPEAYVVLKDGVMEDEGLSEELMALCKQRLAPYQYPRRVYFVDQLPKTATGKVQRFRLREAG